MLYHTLTHAPPQTLSLFSGIQYWHIFAHPVYVYALLLQSGLRLNFRIRHVIVMVKVRFRGYMSMSVNSRVRVRVRFIIVFTTLLELISWGLIYLG